MPWRTSKGIANANLDSLINRGGKKALMNKVARKVLMNQEAKKVLMIQDSPAPTVSLTGIASDNL